MSTQQIQRPPQSIEEFNSLLIQLKSMAASNNGKIMQLLSDGNSDWFNNVSNLIKQLFMEKQMLEGRLLEKGKELDKVYNVHPELAIANGKTPAIVKPRGIPGKANKPKL